MEHRIHRDDSDGNNLIPLDLENILRGEPLAGPAGPDHPGLFLPLLLSDFAPLANGGFEDGWAGWLHGGELAQTISSNDVYGGDFAARRGLP